MTVECVSFLNKCLQYDENKRASVQDLEEHPYITKPVEQQKKFTAH